MMSPLDDPILLSSSVQRAGQVTLTLSRTLTLTASEALNQSPNVGSLVTF